MNHSYEKVLVTGVTGTLGERVARMLHKKGIAVTVLIRDETMRDRFEQQGFISVVGDLTDPSALDVALSGATGVIHCAAYLGDDRAMAIASNVTGVEVLARLALKHRVRRFVHVSTTSVYGEPQHGHYDETTPLAHGHPSPYIATKIESETILNRYRKKGLPLVIVRAGAICAETRSYWGDRQLERMQASEVVTWVHPDDVVPWVHADNLADMLVIAWLRGHDGDVYHGVDANVPDRDFRCRLATLVDKEIVPPARPVEQATYTCDKIRTLGYVPAVSFDEAMRRLSQTLI